MKKILRVAFPLLVFAFMSCEREGEVIPVRKMEKIYREMFLADQWLEENPDKRDIADTTWFYEPIFEKYGVSLADYQKSVDHYLNDPKRYAEMLGRVVDGLNNELGAVNKRISLEDRQRHEADSISRARRAAYVRPFPSFPEILSSCSMTDRIRIEIDSIGVYCPVPVIEDTVFFGPELIIRDSTFMVVKDTIDKVTERSEQLPLRHRPAMEMKLLDMPSKEELSVVK